MTTYVLDLPWLKPPLSLNQRLHWAVEARLKRDVKDTLHVLARQAKLPLNVDHAEVTLTYYPATIRSRDTDNLTATLKPAIDGLIAYGLTADDDHTHITSRCVIGESSRPGRLTLTIVTKD